MNQKAYRKNITLESIFIPFKDEELHMKRIYKNPQGIPVFMLHGAIENGQIFYSESAKGFGPYLAAQGFDVYAADLRGRGMSRPHVNKDSDYGQSDSIKEEIPAFLEEIKKIRGMPPQIWAAHSWGGVLISAFMSRNPEYSSDIDALVYFGAKRYVSVWNKDRILQISFFWNFIARIIVYFKGYLPAKKLGVGSDDESKLSHRGSIQWVKSKNKWIDIADGFDYKGALEKVSIPPILYLAAARDRCLGNPVDVKYFQRESQQNNAEYWLLSKKNGNLHDYDHVSMIAHKDAEKDHYPKILQWIENKINKS